MEALPTKLLEDELLELLEDELPLLLELPTELLEASLDEEISQLGTITPPNAEQVSRATEAQLLPIWQNTASLEEDCQSPSEDELFAELLEATLLELLETPLDEEISQLGTTTPSNAEQSAKSTEAQMLPTKQNTEPLCKLELLKMLEEDSKLLELDELPPGGGGISVSTLEQENV